eukprot:PhF_6_TR2310/c0_g1_i2/m.4067
MDRIHPQIPTTRTASSCPPRPIPDRRHPELHQKSVHTKPKSLRRIINEITQHQQSRSTRIRILKVFGQRTGQGNNSMDKTLGDQIGRACGRNVTYQTVFVAFTKTVVSRCIRSPPR